MEFLRFIGDKEAKNIRSKKQKLPNSPRWDEPCSDVFLLHNTPCDQEIRIPEKIYLVGSLKEIFVCTDHMY